MPALQEGRRSTCLRRDEHQQVCRATSRRLCRNYCTDRPLLARAAEASRSWPASTARLVRSCWARRNPFSQHGERSTCWVVCGMAPHGHTAAWQSHCQCSASACMVKPRCMCLASMTSVDTVGSGAGAEPCKRPLRALSWTSRCIVLDASCDGRLCEIVRDHRRRMSLLQRRQRVL